MAVLVIGLLLVLGLVLAGVRLCAALLGLGTYWQGIIVGMGAVMIPEGFFKLADHADTAASPSLTEREGE
jgi:hypothetical protein